MATDLLKQQEAADMLRVSLGTLYNMRADGSGPAFTRVGKNGIRYDRATLEAYIAGRANEAPSK